jgi:hypothetical protein
MIRGHFPRKQAGATTDRWCRMQSRPPAPHILGSDNIPTLLHQRLAGSHDRTAQLLAAPRARKMPLAASDRHSTELALLRAISAALPSRAQRRVGLATLDGDQST